eukprot:m.220879 g.220879  ORF g.220879 m.220879 type:complete len:429 (-) comp10804_c0_seq11:63-1349(-)
MLLKIYTIELFSNKLSVVGYAALNLFVQSGTDKPPPADDYPGPISLNEGGHQCRLFRYGPNTEQPLSMESMEESEVVPCATLLVRLHRPPRGPTGDVLSTTEVQPSQWRALGLAIPPSPYRSGTYETACCHPTNQELRIFPSLLTRRPKPVRDILQQIGDGQEKRLKNDKARKHWIRSRLTRASGASPTEIPLNFIVKYDVDAGIAIAVDSAMNLPKAKVSHALCSLTPPACIYNHTPLDATLLLTQSFDQSERSTLRSPHWKDDFMLYRRRVFHKHMAVIIDVRGLENAQTLIPQGWTAIQVLSEMGFVRMGRFQLPLYHGAPSPQLLSDIGTMGVDKALKHHLDRKKIKFADGASVIVRVADPRRADTVPYDAPLEGELPPLRKFKPGNDKSKPIVSVVQRDSSFVDFEEEVFSAFETIIQHMYAP